MYMYFFLKKNLIQETQYKKEIIAKKCWSHKTGAYFNIALEVRKYFPEVEKNTAK